MKKYTIEVRKGNYPPDMDGTLLDTIKRVLQGRVIGNFNPFFARYMNKWYLVQSREGDLSDPFRRTEHYATTLFIDIDKPCSN